MKKKDIFSGFTVFVILACLATFILNRINHRFFLGDFQVYYSAASNLIAGKQVYLISYYGGCGFYKYSPATLLFFMPYCCFSFSIAAIIHFFILAGAYWYTFIMLRNFLRQYFFTVDIKQETWLLAISFGCILLHVTRELYLGNINIILLMLSLLSAGCFLGRKDWQGGILFGIVVLLKPYMVILAIPLLLRKRWKAVGWLCATAAGGLVFPFIVMGPELSLRLYGDWIRSIMVHDREFPGMTSLDYIFRLHVMPSWPSWGIFIIFTLGCLLTALFVLGNIRREKQEEAQAEYAGRNFLFELFLIMALLPNLIKTDWVLLLFSAPLITFMIFYTSYRRQFRWVPLLFILIFLYGANSDDLLGRNISHMILQSGLMGLSNFLLIIVSRFMFRDLRKKT
jgi:hypothetical protein